MIELNAYINGKFVRESKRLEIIGPHTNQAVGSVSSLNEEQIENAFKAARNSFKQWRDLELSKRLAYINKFVELLERDSNEIANIMDSEIAKDLATGNAEVSRTIKYIKETITEWSKMVVTKNKVGNKTANITRVPLGVVLAISPFNYPINLSLAKIIPALLIGNSVVFKPATNGSLVGSYLAKLFDEAAFPPGTINVVTGRGREIGDTLVSNKEIDMISFTGGIRVGKNIMKTKHGIPLVLELGGNDAAYVREDADLDRAIIEIVKGAYSYSGQRCTAIKRVIVDKSISDRFILLLSKAIGDIHLGPLVSKSAKEYVKELIIDSKERGDVFLVESEISDNFVGPHLILTDKNSRAWKEEAFGPILPIIIVDKEDPIELINDSNFGLQNSLFTKNIEWAKQVALKIESGSVNINASSSRGPDIFPFSGVKESGFGTQGITEALASMSRILNIVENK